MDTTRIVVLLVALQRLMELAYAKRNTKRLLDRGAVEFFSGHYPLIVMLHTAWLASMFILIPYDVRVRWGLLGAYLLLQPLRIWIILSLGPYWTTRIIRVPGEPLVMRGPYCFMKHPNYALVCAEIALLPLAFGAWQLSLVFSALNLALLSHRVSCENKSLSFEGSRDGSGKDR